MKARSTAETLKGLEKQHGQTLHNVWKPMALQSLPALIPAAASRQVSDCLILCSPSQKMDLAPPCSQGKLQSGCSAECTEAHQSQP